MREPALVRSGRIRVTPFTERLESFGVNAYSVYNRILLADSIGSNSLEDDYWHLRRHVQIWDVGCQKQLEIRGHDAQRLVQLMTPRNIKKLKVGRCAYAPIIDQHAHLLNDPVIIKKAPDHYWLSLADSDIFLWAKGLATGFGLNVEIEEPEVYPLALQGPKAEDLMAKVFGETIRPIRYFRFGMFNFEGHPFLIARSGWSKQGGFEIYLDRPELGSNLWDTMWQAGQEFKIAPGYPNEIERIEGGLLSYGNDMTYEHNPLECGMDRYCDLDDDTDYLGREALLKIRSTGVTRLIRGIHLPGAPLSKTRDEWAVQDDKQNEVGQVSSMLWSPALKTNIGICMVGKDFSPAESQVHVATPEGICPAEICDMPMNVPPA